MGFIDEKSDLFNQIAVVKSIEDNYPKLDKSKVSFDSIKSSKGNIIPLMLDLLKNLVDSSEIKSEFTRFLSKTDTFEEKIKSTIATTIVNTYSKNFDFKVPSGLTLTTSLKNIDISDVLKTDPNSSAGKFNYGDDSTDFTKVLYDAVQSGNGTWAGILNLNVINKETVEIGFTDDFINNDKTFEDFIYDSLNNVRLVKPSLLLTKILDNMYGTTSSLLDNGYEWILDQVKLTETINKIIDSESLGDNVVYDNSFFTFSANEMDLMKDRANALQRGVNLTDLGCGFGENFIDLNSFEDSFNKINDVRPSLVKEATVKFTDTLINQSTVDVSEKNRKNVELNIVSEIFKNLPAIFTSFTMKPIVVTLFQMAESMVNKTNSGGGSLTPSGLDFTTDSLTESRSDKFIQKLKEPIVCLVKQIYAMIVEFLFDKVKSEILKLAGILLAKVMDDQTKNYQRVLKVIKDLLEKAPNIFALIKGE